MKPKTIAIAVTALFGLVVIASIAEPNYIGLGENQWLMMRDANTRLVMNALLVYAGSHGKRFPVNASDANAALLKPGAGYLPNDALERSPYGGQQEALLPVEPPLGKANNPTPTNTYFEGSERSRKPSRWNHLGAVLYDATPDGRRCVVYGICHRLARIPWISWDGERISFSGIRVLTFAASASEITENTMPYFRRDLAELKKTRNILSK